MPETDRLVGLLLDETCLTLEQMSRACAVRPEWVIEHVREGFLVVTGDEPAAWRFSSRDLWRARQLARIERDFDAVPELAALVADLLEELETMRDRLRRAGFE